MTRFRLPSPSLAALGPLLGGLVALALLLSVTLTTYAPQRVLEGTWDAVIEEPGHAPREGQVELPGVFSMQGLDAHTRVRARRTLSLPPSEQPSVLHLESPRYAAVVRWDGKEVARGGEPESDASTAGRSGASLIAVLPADPTGGAHELELDLRGDLYRGGLIGQIRIGSIAPMLAMLQAEVGTRLGFALAFMLVAMLHLLGSLRATERRTELYFGLFTLSVAGYAFEHSTAALALTTDPLQRHLIRRVLVGGMVTFPVLFAASFVWGRLARKHLWWAGVAACTIALSFLGPWWSARMENTQDVLAVICAVWLLAAAVDAWRQRIAGRTFFFAAVVIAMVGAFDEVLVTNGIIPGVRWLYPCLSLFLLFGSLAVIQQDRTLSARHQRLVTGTADAMVELHRSGVVLQLNPAARAFMPGLAVGHRMQDLLPESTRPVLEAHMVRARTHAARMELSLLDGRVVESMATALDANTSLLVLRDVTRRRRAEDDLIQAARLETAGMLVGGVAHDFNNLLSTLLGHVGLLRMTATNDATQERLDRMENSIERASLITRRLLAVGGRSENASTDVDVAAVLDEVVEIAGPALPDGVQLKLTAEGPLPRVQFSDEDLRHVLLNLVLNARDALEERGTIEVSASATAAGVVLTVSDDGPGVAEALRERIFEPFFTTKGPNRGTGLGLPMVRRLVRRHEGTVWLDETHATGARFVMELPVAQLPSPPVRHALGATIAVVDDENALRAAFAGALEAAGYAVKTFADGDTALAALAAAPPHVLVTDVVMPGMSGLQLAASLRDLYPALPVLVVSGYVPASERSLGGPTEHLDKPTRPERVVEAIGRLLGSIEDSPQATPITSR